MIQSVLLWLLNVYFVAQEYQLYKLETKPILSKLLVCQGIVAGYIFL